MMKIKTQGGDKVFLVFTGASETGIVFFFCFVGGTGI
jgi:hypothetical protein